MDPDRWREIEDLCHQVLEKEAGQRETFLREACAGDDSLRKEVEALLKQLSKADNFIESPALDVAAKVLARRRESVVNSDLTGQSLSHYRVLDKIGSGGMGLVYRARDEHLGREVAIKVLPDAFATDLERLARLDREARLMATVSHPNVAAIHGIEVAEEKHFLVLELVEGQTLAQILEKGPLPMEQALEICAQIADGVEAAHNNGIVHRDLKPANVKVTGEGQVKVLDFGLAKPFAKEAHRADPTQSPVITDSTTHPGLIIGTAAYMSPEQASGKPVDKRTDIWAFGCILFECLTGKRAFEGETVSETLASVLKAEPDWQVLPAASPWNVKSLLHRCLEKDPRKRLRDIGDARIEIDVARTAPPVPETASARKPVRSWFLAAGALALVGAGAALITWHFRPTQSLPVVRYPLRIGPGLWLDGMRRAIELERPSRTAMAVANDGSFVVFSAISENPGPQAKSQIYLRRMDQMDATPVRGTEGGFNPFLSPDDRWLGFCEGGKLKKVPVGGGVPATLCDCAWPFGADWGADNTIVFCPFESLGLSTVSGEGGKPEVLTTPDTAKEQYGHRLPHYLPGGRGLLFTIVTTGWDPQPRLALLDLATRKWRILMEDAADGRYLRSGHLVFLRQGTLMAAAFELDRLEVRGQPVPVVANVMQGLTFNHGGYHTAAGQYSVSASGWLAYVHGGILPSPEKLLVRVDQQGSIQPVTDFKTDFNCPRLSADGRRIAYWGPEGHVWTYDLARGTATRVTRGGGTDFVTWTPDGKHLVFGWSKSGWPNLFWQAADGSSPMERLTTSENRQYPGSFSPDGGTLAFVECGRQYMEILFLDMKSRQMTPFLHMKSYEAYPEISPDGRWMAYGSNESGRVEVWVRSFPGPGGRWQISKDGGREPLWSRDGKQLFYRKSDQVWVADIRTDGGFDAGKPRLLFERKGLVNMDPIRNWDLWPDGKGFLMAKEEERSPQPATEVILVQNWFEELRGFVPTK